MLQYHSTTPWRLMLQVRFWELEEPKQSALDDTESQVHTGELPESCFPTWHPALHSLPRGEMGQVLGFHERIKGMP